MCDVWCEVWDLWCVMCDVWFVTCDVWYVTCDVWCVMCDVWCVMCDVWRVMCDVFTRYSQRNRRQVFPGHPFWKRSWRCFCRISGKEQFRMVLNIAPYISRYTPFFAFKITARKGTTSANPISSCRMQISGHWSPRCKAILLLLCCKQNVTVFQCFSCVSAIKLSVFFIQR